MKEGIENNLNLQSAEEEKRLPPERNFEYLVLKEMQEFADAEAPKAEKDWGLIWVLSGPEMDIAKKSTKKSINESRERLKTGLKIAKEVTAVRLGKDPKDVTLEDVSENGPKVFWNATDKANKNLRQRVSKGFLEKEFNFPEKNLIISEDLGIEHTGHQFERFPEKLKGGDGKVVVVSDVYHLPRVRRTSEKWGTFPKERVVLYPSEPRIFSVSKALKEIRKMEPYIANEILPKEEMPKEKPKLKRNKRKQK